MDARLKTKKSDPTPSDHAAGARRSSRKSIASTRYGDGDEDADAIIDAIENESLRMKGNEDPPSDEEGDGLLRATGFIWREPLRNYILAQHAKRQQLERNFETNERSRMFATAARVTEMADKKMAALKERRVAKYNEMAAEDEYRKRAAEEEAQRLAREEEKRIAAERTREERLRRQREAARLKREQERQRRERDEELRKARQAAQKQAKQAEAERRAALPPEQRELEDKLAAEQAAREKEEAASRLLEMEQEIINSDGRSMRKRRRKESSREAEAAEALSGLGTSLGRYGDAGYYNEDLDDVLLHQAAPDIYAEPSGKKKVKGKSTASPRVSPPPSEVGLAINLGVLGGVDVAGHPIVPGPSATEVALPFGAYQGSDGRFYLADGRPYQLPPAPTLPPVASSSASAGKAAADERWRVVEEQERKIWTQIAKRDIPKVARVAAQSTSTRQFFNKRLAITVSREARRAATKQKGPKDIQVRAKRVMREVMLFMRGNEKKERETRRKAEKEALDKAKKEEDIREAKRTARKLNFLITQTELYSHFVGNKLKTSEAEDSVDTAGEKAPAPQQSASLAAAIAAGDAPADAELKALDFDEDDETNVAYHARRNAQAAVDAAKDAAKAFDEAAASSGQLAEKPPAAAAADQDVNVNGELDFQNPTALEGSVQVAQPKMLTCQLKEYQLKGLNWLANLYEQGINGILADEMGLGKTVQSIALMAYLAEVHNIWGPFLVIAPASTLHNWQQEITRFVPGLKALPYWGNTKDRAVLRKFWSRKSVKYDKDAPFHILITSYQLVVQDEKYFQAVKWQYMVLDEAQAIKSASSTRWKTLLGFKCRNRLLLTGTPIQNSMHELWALLHFIMPSLFDSHDEFSEWFSKDIEGTAEKQGAMNEHQLRRLHMILKPFMLRRIKKNVQNELGDKIEIDLYCDLTPRQKGMYRTLRENISITDLVARATAINDDDSVKRLMNLIMQFRKVCNHPELFERADVTAPFAFSSVGLTGSLIRDPSVLDVPYSTKSRIELSLPKTIYREGGIVGVPGPSSRAGFDSLNLHRLMNIWSADHVQQSLLEDNSTFAFLQGMSMSAGEVSRQVKAHPILALGQAMDHLNHVQTRQSFEEFSEDKGAKLQALMPTTNIPRDPSWRARGLVPLDEVELYERTTSPLVKQDARFYMPKAVAPPVEVHCSDSSFAAGQRDARFDPTFKAALFGVANENARADVERFERAMPGYPAAGLLANSSIGQQPLPPMQVPQLQKLILDSGKLAKIDALLAELKTGGHRVLIYFQMTRMIDLFEEYLAFRQYKYLRLDGNSTISERRDMVMDWQTRPELFIFLLSTRAGGLGINLTAADTVIFYDSDWNPSNDAQAMDRAHRLGQTKQVTVYRLITKDTVDERIVQLARNKKIVQDAVVGSSTASADAPAPKTNEVVSLLLDEDELQEGLRQAEAKRKRAEEKAVEDGKRGARAREEKKARLAEEKAELLSRTKSGNRPGLNAKPSSSSNWAGSNGFGNGARAGNDDDDEDGFSFFSNAVTQNPDDLEDTGASGSATPVPDTPSAAGGGGKKGKGKAAPRKRAPKAAAAAAVDGSEQDGEPKAKKPRKRGPTKKQLAQLEAQEAANALLSAAAAPVVASASTNGDGTASTSTTNATTTHGNQTPL